MRSSSSLLGRVLLWIALRLDILTRILNNIFNYNLFRVLRVFRGFFGGLLRKMFWSSEDRVRARFHYAESRQNKP